MKTKKILFLLTTVLISCSPNRKIEYQTIRKGYEYIEYDKNFEIVLTEIYKSNGPSCWAKNFNLLIGNTNSKELPLKISILSSWENFSNFKIGDTIVIKPLENETLKDTIFFPSYFVKDTTINKKVKLKIIGSENKALWGNPILKTK